MKQRKAPKTAFKKGQSGNPGGRPALPEEIKKITRETKPQIIAAYYKLAVMPVDAFREYQPDTMIEAGIKKCIREFAKTGKADQIRHVWAECHGKPKETIDLFTPEGIDITITRVKVDA